MQNRLEILEIKLAHLELTVEELNQVIYEQSKQIDLANTTIKSLQGKVTEMSEDNQAKPFSAEDERPPHY